jgi:hypothetical protein
MKAFLKITFAIFLTTSSFSAFAQKTWDGGASTSNWGDANNWSGNTLPTSSDNVVLTADVSITVNTTTATCANLQLGGTSGNTRGILTFSAAGNPKLTVTGTVTIGGSGSTSANRGGTITFVSGATLEAGSVVLTQSTAGSDNPGTITMTSGSTLIAGSLAVGQGIATFTPSTGTVILKSTNTLPATVFTSFNNLEITAGTTTCSSATLAINANLTLADGTTMIIPNGITGSNYSAGQLYFGSTLQLNSYWGGTNAPFTGSASPYDYYFAPSFYKAYKSAKFGSTTTGILLAGAAALPVTLSSFTAKQTTDNKVSLAWVTSSESVNKGFSIERQEEGSGKFQSLGFIASKAVGGNSQATLAYSFKDVTAKNGTNMYRLVQEDLDGKKTYSEVRVVKLSAQSVSNVFPNPSTGAINISRSNDGKKMNIQVLDQSGRVISQVNNIIDSNYRMNLPQSGIYSIKMMYPETGEQSIQRIVVQK